MPDTALSKTGGDPETFLIKSRASAELVTARSSWRQISYLPVGLFASVMGLTGLSVAWTLAHARFGAPAWIGPCVGYVAMFAFVAIAAGYAVKLVTAPQTVRDEFRHPIGGNLFGTVFVSFLLLPIIVAPINRSIAQAMWMLGALGMFTFAWWMVTRWMSERQLVAHATPAWIVPILGLLDVPLALPFLGLPPMHGVMIECLAVGMFFATPIFTLIFSRLVFEAPMPEALRPSLLILVAPVSVGFVTYVTIVGRIDRFAECLYALMIFLLAVLLPQLRLIGRCCPFRVAWWAISFPLVASAIVALRFAAARPDWFTEVVAWLLLFLSTAVMAWLLFRTCLGLARGELRTLSG
jgi:tellurite resistance protein